MNTDDVIIIRNSLTQEIWDKIDSLSVILSAFPHKIEIYHELFMFVAMSWLLEESLELSLSILKYSSINSNLLELIIDKIWEKNHSPKIEWILDSFGSILWTLDYNKFNNKAHIIFTWWNYKIMSKNWFKRIDVFLQSVRFYRCKYAHDTTLMDSTSRNIPNPNFKKSITHPDLLLLIWNITTIRQDIIDYFIIVSFQLYLCLNDL